MSGIISKIKSNISVSMNIFAVIISAVAFFTAYAFNIQNNMLSACILIAAGIIIFFLFSYISKSIFDIKAIFTLAWHASIGLSCLRYNDAQVPWLAKTWVVLGTGYAALIIGICAAEILIDRKRKKGDLPKQEYRAIGLTFIRRDIGKKGFFIGINALFILCFGTFLFEAAVLGFIPFFSSDMNAYVNFHISILHYLTVSGVLVFPLSYYYFKTYKTSVAEKIWIVVMNIISLSIPILIVSRQLYMMYIIVAMLYLGYMNKKKLILIAVISVAMIAGGWALLTLQRNQNATYLNNVYGGEYTKPSEENADSQTESPEEEKNKAESAQVRNGILEIITRADNKEYKYSSLTGNLPPNVMQPYMYVAFNYDNLNYAIAGIDNYVGHSFGAKSLYPAIALSGAKFVVPALTDFPALNYNTSFTTKPMIFCGYYDFGLIGSVLYMFIVGMICGYVIKRKDSATGMLIKSLVGYALIFCFFTSFFANATFIVYCLMLWVIHLIINFKVAKRKD